MSNSLHCSLMLTNQNVINGYYINLSWALTLASFNISIHGLSYMTLFLIHYTLQLFFQKIVYKLYIFSYKMSALGMIVMDDMTQVLTDRVLTLVTIELLFILPPKLFIKCVNLQAQGICIQKFRPWTSFFLGDFNRSNELISRVPSCGGLISYNDMNNIIISLTSLFQVVVIIDTGFSINPNCSFNQMILAV